MRNIAQKHTFPRLTGQRVNKLQCPPGKINLLYGPKPVFHISHGVAGEQLIKSQQVAVVDGANRFSPHAIATIARRQHVDPEEMLGRIVVSRAFTCYQMESAVTDRTPAFLNNHDCPLLIVLGPLDLFYDEQAPMRDVHRGLQHMLDTLDALKKQGVAILVTSQQITAPHGRGHLFTSLKTKADSVYRLDVGERHFALLMEKTNRKAEIINSNSLNPKQIQSPNFKMIKTKSTTGVG